MSGEERSMRWTPQLTADRRLRPARIIAASAVAAVFAATVTVAGGPGALPATADATPRTLLAATVDELGVAPLPVEVDAALEELVARAIAEGTLAHGVLTVVAGGDPVSVGPFLCAHLRREQRHWAEVGPVWTRAFDALGDLSDCGPGDDAPCGLVLRLRLQTAAALELSAREDCDAECGERLERLRDRIERTARRLETLDADELDPGTDRAGLLREAETAWIQLGEAIAAATARGPGPRDDADEECDPASPQGSPQGLGGRP
jgi:hypothetical protein